MISGRWHEFPHTWRSMPPAARKRSLRSGFPPPRSAPVLGPVPGDRADATEPGIRIGRRSQFRHDCGRDSPNAFLARHEPHHRAPFGRNRPLVKECPREVPVATPGPGYIENLIEGGDKRKRRATPCFRFPRLPLIEPGAVHVRRVEPAFCRPAPPGSRRLCRVLLTIGATGAGCQI